MYRSLHAVNFDNPVYRKTTLCATGEQLNAFSTSALPSAASASTNLSSLTSSSSQPVLSEPSSSDDSANLERRLVTMFATSEREVCLIINSIIMIALCELARAVP